jgi:protein ImuA
MHLAAETGGQTGAHLPLGLLLTPGAGGAAGVETRWHLDPCHDGSGQHWRLERERARTAPRKSWRIGQPGPASPLQIKTA